MILLNLFPAKQELINYNDYRILYENPRPS